MNHVTRSDNNFYFNPKPLDQVVIEGKPTLIECGVSNNDHISIHWNHNNNQIIYDSRRYQQNSNLVIVYADRVLDLGQFTCVATNTSTGYSIQHTIELKVFCEYFYYYQKVFCKSFIINLCPKYPQQRTHSYCLYCYSNNKLTSNVFL